MWDTEPSEHFQVQTEVHQGCLRSPFRFILVIDCIMKETTKGRQNGLQWTPWHQLDDIHVAGDLALLSHTQSDAKKEGWTEPNIQERRPSHSCWRIQSVKSGRVSEDLITLENTPLEEEESFTYLRCMLDKKGGTEPDVNARIGQTEKKGKTFWFKYDVSATVWLRNMEDYT